MPSVDYKPRYIKEFVKPLKVMVKYSLGVMK